MNSRKTVAALVAMNALRGRITPVPTDMDVFEVLAEMPEMGGIHLSESAQEIAAKAQRIEDSRITYLAVNVSDGDLMITMLCDIPEERLTNENEMLSRDGYAFAYVYNNNSPWCSEYGDVFVEKQPDGSIRRVG